MAALRQMAIGCGVDPGYMRASDDRTLLLRLDELPREEFLRSIRCMAKHAKELEPVGDSNTRPLVRVGAMSERALRSIVNDTAADLVAYMNNMDCTSAFLAGDELDIWQMLETTDIELLSHEQLKHMDPFTGLIGRTASLIFSKTSSRIARPAPATSWCSTSTSRTSSPTTAPSTTTRETSFFCSWRTRSARPSTPTS